MPNQYNGLKPKTDLIKTGSLHHLWFTAMLLLLVLLVFILQKPLLLIVLMFFSVAAWFASRTEFQIKDFHIAGAVLFSSIVLPPLSALPGLPDIRVEELLFFLLFPLLILRRESKGKDRLYNYFIYAVIAFGFAIIVSLMHGRYVLGVPVTGSDYFELLKVFKLLIVVAAISRFNLNKEDIYKLLYVVVFSFFISSIIGLMQFYGILGFERITGPYYFAERIYDVHNRMMGTFFNPNTYGTALTLGAVVASVLVFYEKEVYRKVFLTFLVILFSFTLALTQSRTAIIVLLIALIIVFGLNTFRNRLTFKQVAILLTGFLLISVLFIGLLSDEIILRFATLSDITEDTSWQMRLLAWYLNLTIFYESIIFGWGPAKAIHTTIVDSEYILVLRRYGIFGFTFYILIYLIPLYRSIIFQAKDGITGVIGQIVLVSLIVFLIANITNPLFHEIQFIDYWMIILGIFFAIKPDYLNTKKNA